MHPFAGHAAMASATPPGKRSANKVLERFCMLTAPLLSVICEFTRDVGPENFGTVLSVPVAIARAELVNVLDRDAAAATPVLLVVGSAVGTVKMGEPLPAFAKADAGSPPNVAASSAFSAYGTLTSNTLGSSSSPDTSACTPSQRDSPELNKSIGTPSLPVAPSITS